MRTREEGILADPMETQQSWCCVLPAVLKEKISWNDHLQEMLILPTSQFKFINFHLSSPATFSSNFLSKEHTFFWCPWLHPSKSGAFPPDFSLLSISSPLKMFFGFPLFFSLPGHRSSWFNYTSLLSSRKYKTQTQIMECYPIIQAEMMSVTVTMALSVRFSR